MSERKHELTDEDVAWLIETARTDEGFGIEPKTVAQALAALPSRQPKDPDAGLGKLPWKRLRYSQADTYAVVGYIDDTGSVWATADVCEPKGAPHDPTAVARAILAAPDGVKLARWTVAFYQAHPPQTVNERETLALAAKVIAIADGTDGAK